MPSASSQTRDRASSRGTRSVGETADRLALFAQRAIVRLSLFLSALGLTALVLVIVAGVSARWLGTSLRLPHQEAAGYLLAFIVFTGLAAGFESGFPRVTLFYERLRRARPLMDAVLAAAALTYVAILSLFAWQLVLDAAEFGIRTTGVIDAPLAVLQGVMAAGLSLFTLYIATVLARSLLALRPRGGPRS